MLLVRQRHRVASPEAIFHHHTPAGRAARRTTTTSNSRRNDPLPPVPSEAQSTATCGKEGCRLAASSLRRPVTRGTLPRSETMGNVNDIYTILTPPRQRPRGATAKERIGCVVPAARRLSLVIYEWSWCRFSPHLALGSYLNRKSEGESSLC